MIGTAVDAPGEAPRSPAMVPSAEATTSVPNCSTPPLSLSFLMTWTRWPAVISYQSSGLASGMNSTRAANLSFLLASTCLTRYQVRSRLSRATASMGRMLCDRIDRGRSSIEPDLRNFGLKPA